jgi:hypothetical protein
MSFQGSVRNDMRENAAPQENAGELPPLLAWLGTAAARPVGPPREDLAASVSAYVRRQPLQSVALAAAGGFVFGVLCARR